MKLPFSAIAKLAHGCCEVREEENGIFFDRMTGPLREFYGTSESGATRMRCPAGVRLRFRSDTPWIKASFRYGRAARPIRFGDLIVDRGEVRAFGPAEAVADWSGEIYREEDGGEREFDLWLPHLVESWLASLEVADGARVAEAAPSPVTMLAIGDSITQGMTGKDPADTYVARAARGLGVNLHNVGVGGARMEKVVGAGAAMVPCSLATVAFGVNDWWGGAKSLDRFRADADALLSALLSAKHDLPIALLTPLPVYERAETNKLGLPLEDYRQALRDAAHQFASVTLIEGATLISNDPAAFVDGVHPNDRGMKEMGVALTARLKGMLPE